MRHRVRIGCIFDCGQSKALYVFSHSTFYRVYPYRFYDGDDSVNQEANHSQSANPRTWVEIRDGRFFSYGIGMFIAIDDVEP